MKVALYVGHFGKPEPEAILVLRYAPAAAERLQALGHQALILSDGTYTARAERARTWGAQVHVHLHLDVRNDPRAVVLYDPASPAERGPALAARIGRALDARVPELGVSRAWAATPTASPGGAAIVARHRQDAAPCIVYEPARVQDVVRWMASGRQDRLESLGAALADGIHGWAASAG